MKRSGPHTPLFPALILAAAGLGATAAWAPLATCPLCLGRPLEVPLVGPGGFSTGRPAGFRVVPCDVCADRRRVSWLQKRRWVNPGVRVSAELLLPPPR